MAAARLTVTELLPTPPFPDAMASTRVVAGIWVSGAFSRAAQRAFEHDLGALVGGHLAPVDRDVAHAGVGGDPGLDVLLDLGAERTAGDRQLHADAHVALGRHVGAGRHAEVDDVAAELRIDHAAQEPHDLFDGRR